jgi:hypothetical protein
MGHIPLEIVLFTLVMKNALSRFTSNVIHFHACLGMLCALQLDGLFPGVLKGGYMPQKMAGIAHLA